MSLIKATWALYRDAASDTWKVLRRSGVALLFLVLASAFELVLFSMLGGAGIAGGFVAGLVDAFLCAWYLALLRVLVVGNRKLMMSDLRDVMGDHFWEVITIGFVFGIPRIVISLGWPELNLVYIPLVALVFNPIPEMVYQSDREAFDMIPASMRFMQENWPEWLAGHVLLFGALGAMLYALIGQPSAAVAFLAGLYGPWFGFLGIGPAGLVLLSAGPLGVALSAALFLGSHLVMVFRGVLYKKLSRSNRRGRAWQARM
ncbi:MAG: hypothetical protein R3F61_31580 [Myxococcota bacterium]